MLFENDNDAVLIAWGIRLNPDQETVIINVAEKIHALQPLKYLINRHSSLPYIHLFEALIPTIHLEAADEIFNRVVKLYQTFEIKWGQIEETQNQIILWTQPNDELKKLQLMLMSNINDLREGLWKEKYNSEVLDQFETESVAKWGNPYASDLLPYVVIGKSEKPLNIAKLDIEWPFRRLIIRRLFVAIKEGNGRLTMRHQFRLIDSENLI